MPSTGLTFEILKDALRDQLFDGIKDKDERRIARAVKKGLEKAATDRDWSHMLVRHYRALTVAPYTTGTIAIAAGSTSVTGTSTVFTDAMVGRWIRINGVPELYQIATRVSDDGSGCITLHDAVKGAVASGTTFEVLAIDYDLPANCREVRRVIDNTRRALGDLKPTNVIAFDEMLSNFHNAGGFPDYYCIGTKRDSVTQQLRLFPAPSEARYYQVVYVKWPGWYNATTGAFETEPTADSSIADWPLERRGVLEAAILLKAAQEWKNPSWQQQAASAYQMEFYTASKRDQANLAPAVLHQGGQARPGDYPVIRDNSGNRLE